MLYGQEATLPGWTVDRRPIARFWWRQRIALAAFASCGEQGAVPLALPGRARLPLPSIHDPTAETFTFTLNNHVPPSLLGSVFSPFRLVLIVHRQNPCYLFAGHFTIAIAAYVVRGTNVDSHGFHERKPAVSSRTE
jgi:hypothetical protein